MTIERIYGVNAGGYRITSTVDGYYVSKLYIGYTKQEAITQFKRDCKTFTR